MRGSEWGEQIAWLVVMQHIILGYTVAEIAFNLLPNGPKERTIRDILKRYRDGVKLTDRDRARRRDKRLSPQDRLFLMDTVLENPVQFLEEIQRGIFLLRNKQVSVSTLCVTLKELGLTRQKIYTLSANYCEWKRVLFWQKYQDCYTIEQLIFTDESGVKTLDVMRRFQRFWRGQRSQTRSIFVSNKTHTMIPVMSIFGVLDYSVFRVPSNSDVRGTNTRMFKRFVTNFILPHLQPFPLPHSVLVMDRASIHFRPDVIDLIERRGAKIFATAPYCPWDNPTEQLHAWIKSWLKRHHEVPSEVGLDNAIRLAFQSVPENYAFNTIRNCGY